MSTLWPDYLPTPEQDGYRLRRGAESVSIRLDGGRSRVRRDILGASHEATCTFLLDSSEYVAFEGFFREQLDARTALFRLPLLIDTPVAVNHLVRVLDDPEELASTRGHAHTVQVRLEVLPNPMKSHSLVCENFSDPLVDDGGAPIGADGDMSQFPIGRDVLLMGCSGLVDGVLISLDGTYEIASKPTVAQIELANASTVNAGWTTLGGTATRILFPTNRQGACILLPE